MTGVCRRRLGERSVVIMIVVKSKLVSRACNARMYSVLQLACQQIDCPTRFVDLCFCLSGGGGRSTREIRFRLMAAFPVLDTS